MKILVVDDEPVVLEITTHILHVEGHEVLTAISAEEALKMCEALGEELDLVISDVSMPGISGRELAECIAKMSKPIPVLLISGYPQDRPKVQSVVEQGKLDDVDFLEKPFTPKQLLTVVARFQRTNGAPDGR